MSLKAIAEQELARLRAGETAHETERETEVEQAKQAQSCFIDASDCFPAMKRHKAQDTATDEACFTVSFPRGGTHETSPFEDLRGAIQRLKGMRIPRAVEADRWHTIVADALRMAGEGWLTKALALGWSAVDLFGAVPDREGDPAGDGLVVWLNGRALLAITAQYAVADDGSGGRSYFNRREAAGAVLLWELSNSRREL